MKHKGYLVLWVILLIFIIHVFVPSLVTNFKVKNGDVLKINYHLSSRYQFRIYLDKEDPSINQLESLIQISSDSQSVPIDFFKKRVFPRKENILIIYDLEEAALEARGFDKKNIEVSVADGVTVNLYRISNRGFLATLYLIFDRDYVKRGGEWTSFSKLNRE